MEELQKQFEESQKTIEKLKQDRSNTQNFPPEKKFSSPLNNKKLNNNNSNNQKVELEENLLPPLPPPLPPQYPLPSESNTKNYSNKSSQILKESPTKTSNYQSTNSVLLDVDLGDGKKGRIDVNISSNPIVIKKQYHHFLLLPLSLILLLLCYLGISISIYL